MGFSSALQSSKGHEQLLSRQDAELRLIDIMKRSMQQKAKCDREYAIGLANVAQQGLKIDRTDELQGSHITKAWRSFMDELEQTSRQLKLNADHLEAVCQDKLTQLYHDKRKARKQYQEEHLKISQQFTHITEDVQRKKVEYQKHLDNYKVLRARFEEQFVKGGRSGRKIDDVADKYKKACRKLHLAHNEYVLLINEAIEIEKDFRTILLPGLLEHQQTLQEGFIQTWKNLLLEIIESGDLTSEKFGIIQRRVENTTKEINPGDEYKEFTEKYKTCPPTPTLFQFDESLIEDNLGKLQANTLTVDNLTVEWLRTRLGELEGSVKECQDKQAKYCNENSKSAPGTPTMNGVNGHNGTKDLNKNSKDLQTLRCQERQMLKLVEIIKTALNEIGCEELPSGCDDVIEQTFIDNNLSHDQSDTPHSSSYLLQKGHEVMSIFRTFRRKSGPPNSPTRTPKHGRSSENLGSSVISLDFREVTTCDDCNENVIDDANNDCTNNNVNVTNTDHISDTEEVFEDIDVISDTNNIINNNNDVCYRSTNNIYVDIEANDMHNETNPFCSHQFVGDESLKTIETEVEIDEDDEVEMKSNENLRVSKTVEEKNDSKNNLLLGGDDNNSNKDENKKSEEIMQKSMEKLSFTEKLKNKIRKSSSTDGTTIGLTSDSKDNNKDTNVSNLKDRFNRFKNAKGDNYRSLSETESEASRASFKKLKGKSRKKRLFRQLTEEQNLMGCEEKFESIENPENLKSIIPSTGKKKSKSISSTIMTHIRDIKMKNGGNKVREIDPKDREKTKAMTNEMSNRLSEIKFLFEAEAKDIEFEEIVESEAESLINVKHPIEQAGYHSLFPYDKPEDTIKNEDFTSMPPHIQITDLDDDETIEYPIENQNLNPSESKSKFKFAQSIKSRLKLRLRKHKKLSETSFHDQTSPPKACNMCTKPIKCNLHASPTVADFEKEFHTSEIFVGDVYYCSCVRDESSCCSDNSSADGNITIKNRNIEVKTSTDSIKSSSTSNCSVRENDTFIFFSYNVTISRNEIALI